MNSQPSDDELKLNRRLFLQHTAYVTALTASAVTIAAKTDALAQSAPPPRGTLDGRGSGLIYPYT